MIPFEVDIGFAIGRLISVFYEMGVRLTGDPQRVHFSFGRVGTARSPNLPSDFQNLLEFDYRKDTPADRQRLAEYVGRHNVSTIFALDMPVDARCLGIARQAGVRCVVSYLGPPRALGLTADFPAMKVQAYAGTGIEPMDSSS